MPFVLVLALFVVVLGVGFIALAASQRRGRRSSRGDASVPQDSLVAGMLVDDALRQFADGSTPHRHSDSHGHPAPHSASAHGGHLQSLGTSPAPDTQHHHHHVDVQPGPDPGGHSFGGHSHGGH